MDIVTKLTNERDELVAEVITLMNQLQVLQEDYEDLQQRTGQYL